MPLGLLVGPTNVEVAVSVASGEFLVAPLKVITTKNIIKSKITANMLTTIFFMPFCIELVNFREVQLPHFSFLYW